MESIISLFKDNWILAIILVILAIIVVRVIISSMYKIAFFLLGIGAVLVFLFGYTPDEVTNMGKEVAGVAKDRFVESVKPVLEKEIKEAKYTKNKDGTYVVQTSSVKINGQQGDKNVTVHFKGLSFDIELAVIEALIKDNVKEFQP